MRHNPSAWPPSKAPLLLPCLLNLGKLELVSLAHFIDALGLCHLTLGVGLLALNGGIRVIKHRGRGPTRGDPTATSSARREKALARLSGEYDRLAGVVEDAHTAAAVVRSGLGDGAANALSWYYLAGGLVTWFDVAVERKPVSAVAAKKRCSRALAWLEGQG